MATTRNYWVSLLERVSKPVLEAAAKRQLVASLPIKAPEGARTPYDRTYLEAIGRSLCGITPWFELTLEGEEHKKQQLYLAYAHDAIVSICDPSSPDFHPFTENQFLVDSAFLSHALIRSPNKLLATFSGSEKQLVIEALQACRKIKPHENNWLLFAAMVECGIDILSATADLNPVQYALERHESWYVGDGTYGDGPHFHWDYYNSYVIIPMLSDICNHFSQRDEKIEQQFAQTQKHLMRFADIQERLIAPDGTYPVFGRSICYRSGAFQALAQAALQEQLPSHLSAAQARCALTAMLKQTLGNDKNYGHDGWLELGLVGTQEGLAERYLSTGSLYLCNAVFLPLGLAPDNAFWSDPDCEWTSQLAWSGQQIAGDHAI